MAEIRKLTLSVIKLETGGFIGETGVHPEILDTSKAWLINAREKSLIAGFHVLRCGPDIDIIIMRWQAAGGPSTEALARDIASQCADAARDLGLLSGRSGRPEGPGVVDLTLSESASGAIIVLLAHGTRLGSWNLPLSRIFADPFNTGGLSRDPAMTRGFSFDVLDRTDGTSTILSTPKDIYTLISLATQSSRYVIRQVRRNSDNETACTVAVERVNGSGAPVLSDDSPAVVLRCGEGFPAVGETLEPFAVPHLVSGTDRNEWTGPLMPVPFYEAQPTRFNGPPRLMGAGFQLSRGRLLGPHDMFDDPGFDSSRRLAGEITNYLKRHGPFDIGRPAETGSARSSGPIPLNRVKERLD